ncbi:MAG: metabolite traffic protein EboE [Cyanobacteria bacterium J06621_8]
MKLPTKSDLHLTYCTNIHPGETWAEVENNLKQYIPQLKTRLAPDDAFGLGLRLADIASRELLEGDKLKQFQNWLISQNLYVFTLNGFPFGSFHRQVVKDQVYAPDWSKVERLDYTLRLIKILTTLLPPQLDGGISTLPISYKPWFKDAQQQNQVLTESCLNLARAIAEMVQIRETTGKLIHLDLEPEPNCMLENTQEMIDFFQDWLFPLAGKWLQENQGVTATLAQDWIREHIRVCYDTCHFAVEYEEPQEIIHRLEQVGIKIGKIQLSSAIKIEIPPQKAARQPILDKIASFDESTYLHQVIARNSQGNLKHYVDLGDALEHFLTTDEQEWRTHFHVPIFMAQYQLFKSTQDHILQLLPLLSEKAISHHLEIETYTWEVLPPAMKLDILTSIEREYQWVLSAISHQSLAVK